MRKTIIILTTIIISVVLVTYLFDIKDASDDLPAVTNTTTTGALLDTTKPTKKKKKKTTTTTTKASPKVVNSTTKKATTTTTEKCKEKEFSKNYISVYETQDECNSNIEDQEKYICEKAVDSCGNIYYGIIENN